MRHPSVFVVAAALVALYATAGDAPDPGISAEQAARDLVRTQISPDYMEEIYQQVAQQMSTQFQAEIQPKLNRALTDSEKQRLVFFWHGKLKELLPYSTLEDLLAPIVTKHLTLSEIQEVNRFYGTPLGKKLIELTPRLTREAQAGGEELGRRLADPKWLAQVVEDLKGQFPQWFPALDAEKEEP